MWDKEQQNAWEDIKNVWNGSSEGQEIKIAMSQLMVELKSKTTQFEKDLLKRDIQMIKNAVSEFEKETIKKDVQTIHDSVREFEKDFVKSILSFFTHIIKKISSALKGKNN